MVAVTQLHPRKSGVSIDRDSRRFRKTNKRTTQRLRDLQQRFCYDCSVENPHYRRVTAATAAASQP